MRYGLLSRKFGQKEAESAENPTEKKKASKEHKQDARFYHFLALSRIFFFRILISDLSCQKL